MTQMTANKIKRLRKRLGLTQEQFAKKLDVSRSSVARWELGQMPPGKWNQHMLKQLEKEAAA